MKILFRIIVIVISFLLLFVKRCVAIPGDTISMVNGYFQLTNGVQVGLLQSQKRR